MMTSIFHLMMTYMGIMTMGSRNLGSACVSVATTTDCNGLPNCQGVGFSKGGSNNKKANIRKWGVISRHWVPVTGNPELWTHYVLQGGKDVLKSLKMSEEAFNATEYRLVFLTSVLLSGASLLVPLPL